MSFDFEKNNIDRIEIIKLISSIIFLCKINILVTQIDHGWKVSGVLDWEFSFSGPVLCDVANILRYSHQMPSQFEKSFLQGLKIGGVHLPEHWRITAQMLNIIALLDNLKRDNAKKRPKQNADILNLISIFLEELEKNQ